MLTSTQITFDNTTDLIESEELWEYFLDSVEKVDGGEEVSR